MEIRTNRIARETDQKKIEAIIDAAEMAGYNVIKLVTTKPRSKYEIRGFEVIVPTTHGQLVNGVKLERRKVEFVKEESGLLSYVVPYTGRNKAIIASRLRKNEFIPIDPKIKKECFDYALENGMNPNPQKMANRWVGRGKKAEEKAKKQTATELDLVKKQRELEKVKEELARTKKDKERLYEEATTAKKAPVAEEDATGDIEVKEKPIVTEEDLLDYFRKGKAGAWYVFGDEKINGKEKAREIIKKNWVEYSAQYLADKGGE